MESMTWYPESGGNGDAGALTRLKQRHGVRTETVDTDFDDHFDVFSMVCFRSKMKEM
jgi:hypothetical protein